MTKKVFYAILLFCLASFLLAEINFESYVDNTKIGLQDRLNLTLEISGSDANKVAPPQLPRLDNFSNLGSSTSSSSSYSFANGKAQSNITKKYIHILRPQKSGDFIIPPLKLTHAGQTYTTKPIKIKVVEGSTAAAPPTSQRMQANSRNESNSLEDNLFLKAVVSDKQVYRDQPITVEYILYSRYEISNLAFGEDSGYQGFWKETLFVPEQINFTTKTENGIRYNTMLMKKVLLFPRESGNLEIPSLQIKADIRTQARSFFDFGSTKTYTLESKPQTINVKSLPPAPENFSGAVGTFQLSSRISSSNLQVGDSFTYTLEISGKGNLKNFTLPELPAVNHLRFLDPETATQLNADGVSGKRTIKYLVIAKEQGQIDIPPLSFTFFDPTKASYTTRKTANYNLSVAAGDMAYIPSSRAQMSVEMEGADIGFLAEISELKSDKMIYKSWFYWSALILLLLSLPASFIYRKEQEMLSSNQDYYRTKQANKILKKYMKDATSYAKENKADFYSAAQSGLANYLADKLHIARGSTSDFLLSELKKQAISDELFAKVTELYSICNQARFMPGGFSDQQISQHHSLLKNVINDLSKVKFK